MQNHICTHLDDILWFLFSTVNARRYSTV